MPISLIMIPAPSTFVEKFQLPCDKFNTHNGSQWQLIIFIPQVTKEEFVKNAMKSPFIASLLN